MSSHLFSRPVQEIKRQNILTSCSFSSR